MTARTHLCGGSSPRLAPAPIVVSAENAQAIATGLPAVRVLVSPKAPILGPDEAFWRALSADPRTAVFLDDEGAAWRAAVGEEPIDREELVRRRCELGHGGRGFALRDAFGEETVTHDLWSPERVPAPYAPLFRATHVGYRALTVAEEDAYWKARESAGAPRCPAGA